MTNDEFIGLRYFPNNGKDSLTKPNRQNLAFAALKPWCIAVSFANNTLLLISMITASTIQFTVVVPNRHNFFIFSTLGPTEGPSGTTNATKDGAKGKEGPTSVSLRETCFGND